MATNVQKDMTNRTIISVKAVSKAFGKIQALKGVDLELQTGKVLGLLGPNSQGDWSRAKQECVLIGVFSIWR